MKNEYLEEHERYKRFVIKHKKIEFEDKKCILIILQDVTAVHRRKHTQTQCDRFCNEEVTQKVIQMPIFSIKRTSESILKKIRRLREAKPYI